MGEGLKGPMTNLARVIQDLAQPGTRGEVQSDYLTDKMSVKEVILASEQINDTPFELLAGDGR